MSSTETIILVTGVAATLQLCRISIDLISTASQKDAVITHQLDTASRNDFRASVHSKRSSFFSRKTKQSELSETVADLPPKGPLNTSSATVPIQSKMDEEGQAIEELLNESGSQAFSSFEKVLVNSSIIASLGLFCYFATICILNSLRVLDDSALDPISLGCAAVFFFLAAWVSLRDPQRIRFTNVQRTFSSLAVLLLLLGVIFRVALVGENDLPGPTDIASLVLLLLYTGLALCEAKVLRYPLLQAKDRKARLSLKAVFTVLKPYFWPDATASSATLNRLRAMATWFFVIGSKACGLLAPIYIGRAATDLSRLQYESSIRNVIWYSLLTLASAVLREGQGLVYLRVAQAAFVQLAELSFRHLHSLSLDWHLRKKLGEVVRSMDRGILACDTLIKYLFLWLIPAIAECILVVVIFATYFDYLPLAVVIFYFVFAYMLLTVLLTLWRKKFHKQVTRFVLFNCSYMRETLRAYVHLT